MMKDQENEIELHAMAAAGVHETAVAMLTVPKTARIADIPSGEGALAQRILNVGFQNVVCGDIQFEKIALKDRASCVRVDLREALPFADGDFDAVCCIECIEHLENPYHLMRELSRITKPGGQIILSTPNIMSTNARSKYLTVGYFPHFIELAFDWKALESLGFQGHITPVSLTQLLFMAFLNKLAVEEIRTNRFKRQPKLKDKLLAWVIRRTSQRFFPEDVRRLLTSDAVLYGEIIILRLIKQLASSGDYRRLPKPQG
jgi:SAM-dependent methyltransferase